MNRERYLVNCNGPKVVEVSWEQIAPWSARGAWGGSVPQSVNLVARMDGNTLGTVQDVDDLIRGSEFPLPDGSLLKVRTARTSIFMSGSPCPGLFRDQLRVLHNGRQLRSASSQRMRRLLLYGAAAIGVLLGAGIILAIVRGIAEQVFLIASVPLILVVGIGGIAASVAAKRFSSRGMVMESFEGAVGCYIGTSDYRLLGTGGAYGGQSWKEHYQLTPFKLRNKTWIVVCSRCGNKVSVEWRPNVMDPRSDLFAIIRDDPGNGEGYKHALNSGDVWNPRGVSRK